MSGFEDQTFGALLSFMSPSPVGTLTYGVEYYHDEVDSAARSYNADGSLRSIAPRGPVADDASSIIPWFTPATIGKGFRNRAWA